MKSAVVYLLASLIAAACGGGCIIAGYAAHVYGDPPVAAKYTLGPRLTAVVVKDPPDPTGETIEGEVLASEIEQNLKAHKIENLVPTVKASDLRSSNPTQFETLPPAQLGQALGAEQIVYVDVLRSGIGAGEGNDMLKGQIAATVAVYDCKTGQELWPADGSAGETVTYATPMLRNSEDVNELSVHRNIYAGLADKVAKLFYTYKPDEE